MDMKWMEDFLCLAATRSFTRSASERHSSQSAFSRRIRSLETWLGTELVDRGSNPPCLTPAGHAFRGAAINILQQVQQARNIAHHNRNVGGCAT